MLNELHIPWLARASKRARYLVGVSGGADSVALLGLLLEHGFRNLVVCHLDHRLRGRASTEDARFVSRLAGKSELQCEIGRADVAARMRESGESMETAARRARHEFFGECAAKHRCRRILLAHHGDDQAETVLWNLLRGSHGCKGMREEQRIELENGKWLELLRPLLGVRHEDLTKWLESRGQRWREDASNREPVGVRNRLRNEVVPLLEVISGRDAVAAFCRAADVDLARDEADQRALDAVELLDPQGRLYLPALRGLAPHLQMAAMKRFLGDGGVGSLDRRLLGCALEMVDVGNAAVINLPGGGRLRRSGGRIWIEQG